MTTKLGTRTPTGGVPTRARLIAVPVALAAIALLTSACSTQGSSAAPQATVTVTAVPSHSVTANPSGPPPASATPTAAAPSAPASQPAPASPAGPPPPAPCSTRYLGGSVGVTQGAAGSTYVVLVLKNLNNSPCTLYGYPGVALDAGVPVTPVGLAAAEDPTTPRQLITLAPYGTANALLHILDPGNYPPAQCDPVTTTFIQIIPPNQTVPVYVGYTTQTCAKPVQLLTVDAMRPGSGSS